MRAETSRLTERSRFRRIRARPSLNSLAVATRPRTPVAGTTGEGGRSRSAAHLEHGSGARAECVPPCALGLTAMLGWSPLQKLREGIAISGDASTGSSCTECGDCVSSARSAEIADDADLLGASRRRLRSSCSSRLG
jgi:hypothetical protein